MLQRILNNQTPQYLGKKVRITGWIQTTRSHGKIIFADIRDKSGLVQAVFGTRLKPEIYNLAQKLRSEWVVEIIGQVNKRPTGMKNPKIETGGIEIQVENLKVLSQAKTLPFPIDSPGYEISEEKRLKYRYLDLRRERMKKNLEMRQKVIQFMRNFLIKEEFIEIETPLLTKSTPEGARDFLVPSRLYPGKFYALPQSPQQYKQMLQVAGIERYFQIARVLRDEDPRADRQAEHTQLDIEMAFVSQNEILDLVEKLYISLVRKLFPEKKIQKIPFPRLKYKEIVEKYHSDKPDIRKNKSNQDELAFCFVIDFPMFEWHKNPPAHSTSSGSPRGIRGAAGSGRGNWGAQHHPFTKPKTEDIKTIKKNPGNILAFQYDFVLNGYEIGGGSIRTTNLDVLSAVFEVLGHNKKEIKKQFHHYFEAFGYGVPPHGGIAMGIDRFLTVVLNEPNIREVIAFPKTGDNRDLMMDVPSEVTEEQLSELNLKLKKPNKPKK